MKHIVWGAFGGALMLIIWTLAHVTKTTMPVGFADMQPMGLVGAGFFWGVVTGMVREKIGGQHG